ncbi:hypothetical protein Tco_0045045 [Tanacetum coccineum]
MCRRASAKLSSKWRFRKISMNFKAKRSSFSWIFSLFTLDGYGKVALVLGMTIGSSIWTIGGWTSLVLSLGSTVSFVTSVSTSTTGRQSQLCWDIWFCMFCDNASLALTSSQNQFLTHRCLDELGLPFPEVLVLVPTILIVGLAVVLHGRKTGWSDLVCHRWRTPDELRYVVAYPRYKLCSTAFTGAGAGTGDVCLSRSRALTISFNSATSGDTPEVEALVLTLATMALLRELLFCFSSLVTNFDLLSMCIEQSAGLLSKCYHLDGVLRVLSLTFNACKMYKLGSFPRIHEVDMLGGRSFESISQASLNDSSNLMFELVISAVLYQAISWLPLLREKEKASNLNCGGGTLGISQSRGDFIDKKQHCVLVSLGGSMVAISAIVGYQPFILRRFKQDSVGNCCCRRLRA